jgi:predicted helicase
MPHATTENILHSYLMALERELQQGIAREHSYRPALKTLIETLYPGTLATNEPKRIRCGAPDYIVTDGQIPLGYIEAKDIGVSLVQIESDSEKARPTTREGEQLRRYRESLSNLIFTDYIEFRWFLKGKRELVGRLATLKGKKILLPDSDGVERTKQLLQSYMQARTPTVTSPRELATRMAAIAKLIRVTIEHVFDDEEEGAGSLQSQLDGFKQVLLPDLTPQAFADMYAQTICYGLFAARCNHTSGTFTRRDAVYDIPKTNPFLRKTFNHIAGIELDERINWAVDGLAELLNRADTDAILKDFGRRTRQEDPMVHFYETFLAEYDPTMREKRGVYYTPEPVVSYIVRSVDHLLKTTFQLPDGLADMSLIPSKTVDEKIVPETHRVQILDPATGTATFLHGVIDLIHESFTDNQGMWSSYVSRHLLPRLFGLELLMAPYAVAHMKLGLQLKDTGYDFKSDERLRIYLTNTLEESYEHGKLPFAEWLIEEATEADRAKHDVPVMVVLGNPPYSGLSANNGKWIYHLLRGKDTQTRQTVGNYFEVDGKSIREKKNWLNNDYVKFMRFAQWRIEKTGYGILAFITDNSYLNSPTFRGMRQSLLQTFDDIYLLNLHGNSKRKDRSPDGSPDQNVFDITQGVVINIFVKHSQLDKNIKHPSATVYHANIWGTRESKYSYLSKEDSASTTWTEVKPRSPFYLFAPQNISFSAEYELGWQVTKIMSENNAGIVTARDFFVVALDEDTLLHRIEDLRSSRLSDDEIRTKYFEGKGSEKYVAGDTRGWKLPKARAKVRLDNDWKNRIVHCLYRPFDVRPLYYVPWMVDWPRPEIMQHMLTGENLGLSTTRSIEIGRGWEHVFCTSKIIQHHTVSIKEVNYLFPLYLYPDNGKAKLFDLDKSSNAPGGRRPNLASAFITELIGKIGLTFIPDGKGTLQETVGPEDVFNYMYAVFHSPTYRERYAEFLKIDFPRLPLTSNSDLFRELCNFGEQLVGLHLMEKFGKALLKYPIKGNNLVEKIEYLEPQDLPEQGRVYISKTQYFDGVPSEVWNFHVGGYQICHKWLNDRKGRILSFDDIQHYQRIVSVLGETIQIMDQIDEAIEDQGGWPIM